MPIHRKIYTKYGNGVELRCGDKLVVSNPYKGTNFSISDCPFCGMEVHTIGCSPDTDEVQELRGKNNG